MTQFSAESLKPFVAVFSRYERHTPVEVTSTFPGLSNKVVFKHVKQKDLIFVFNPECNN